MSLSLKHCLFLSAASCVSLTGCAHPEAGSGSVFVDNNGNGVRDSGEEGVRNAIVFYEDKRHSKADSAGNYSIKLPDNGGMLWVRSQDEHAPGPFWINAPAGVTQGLDIPVRPTQSSGEFSFVVGSDTHAGIEQMSVEDQIIGLAQAAGVAPKPYFITITGDITSGNKPEQFESVFTAIDAIDVPYVPVPGNHDWYDGGEQYRKHFGPPNYAFDAGGVHFVVLEWEASSDSRMDFLDMDLALINDERPVVVLMHAPPRDELRAKLDERGIDVLLTGHMHTNRVLQHDTFVEYSTQPMVMGGMDLTPGGFRIFHFDDQGGMTVDHRTTVNRSVFEFVSPAVSQVFAPCKAKLIVAVEPGASITSLSAMVDGVGEVALTPTGGWTYSSEVLSSLCTPGSYLATADLESGNGEGLTASTNIEIGALPISPALANWPMFQGDPTHSGATAERIEFPLQMEWAATVGGHIHGGSPVVADGRVFVSVSDFGDGILGGVVALDAKTGTTLWEHRVGFSVRNAPAVSGDVVLFISNDGTVHGVSAATGDGLWTYELAPDKPSVQRNIYSSPTVVDGIAYLGGRFEFVAMEAETGDIVWSVPILDNFGDLSSHASAAVSGDMGVVPFNRVDGLFAFDRETGTQMWNTEFEVVRAAHASPVIDGDIVYVVNELTRLTAIGMEDAASKWGVTLEGGAFGWGFLAESTPALQGTTLVVGTQRGGLYAIDTANRNKSWLFEADPALIRATHYHGESPAITAAPVITGDLIWLPGQDGVLRALDLVTGDELWAAELGVPMSSSPAVAGQLLIVASYDGSVRAMRTLP